ncbi:MAG: hypothetical protein ABI606_00855 [Rhodoferax sp.]
MEWIESGGVRGNGFSIQTGFNFAIYREGSLAVQFTIKRGFRGQRHLVVVPSNAFGRWDGCTDENSPEDQRRMRDNFIAAMSFSGCLVE